MLTSSKRQATAPVHSTRSPVASDPELAHPILKIYGHWIVDSHEHAFETSPEVHAIRGV
jgi:hypothetical protein